MKIKYHLEIAEFYRLLKLVTSAVPRSYAIVSANTNDCDTVITFIISIFKYSENECYTLSMKTLLLIG